MARRPVLDQGRVKASFDLMILFIVYCIGQSRYQVAVFDVVMRQKNAAQLISSRSRVPEPSKFNRCLDNDCSPALPRRPCHDSMR